MSRLTAYDKFIQVALKYGFSLFGLPKTGQTIIYQAGDDGTYQKGYPKTEPRFIDNNDGTIYDRATGLEWIKDPSALGGVWGSGITPTKMTCANAIINSEALNYAGHTDWRLPNIKELQSIVDYGTYSPAINSTYFPNTQSDRYWSGTTYAAYTGSAWFVSFGVGDISVSDKVSSYYVRPVRLG
jgi:hypothetical protein